MKKDKKDGEKKRIKVRNVGKTASKELTEEEERLVSGGAKYSCPGDCGRLVVVTVVARSLLVFTDCPDTTEDLVLRIPRKR